MPVQAESNEREYLIPAPVLTSSDKLFNFGTIAFSVMEMLELLTVAGLIALLWQILFFIPWPLRAGFAALIFFTAFLFITQPINGLPGDTWIRYAFKFYVLERKKHAVLRRGRNYVKVQRLTLLDSDGRPILTVGDAGG